MLNAKLVSSTRVRLMLLSPPPSPPLRGREERAAAERWRHVPQGVLSPLSLSPLTHAQEAERGEIPPPLSPPPPRAKRGKEKEDTPQINDTHDCTTAPIINGRLPLHLLGQQPPCCSERGQPYRRSAFPSRLTRVVTNHQRSVHETHPPFRSLRSLHTHTRGMRADELVLDTKHLMLRLPPPVFYNRPGGAQHAS